MIKVQNVSKSYQGKAVLEHIDVSIPRGGITSIIGPNGAGKSTLLSTMGRLLPLESGSVHINGLDIQKTSSDILAQNVSILRQENQFSARLTVDELVSFGRYPYSKGRLTQEDRQIIKESLEFSDLTGLSSRFLDELSGGQRQRAYVAMVLCQNTDYVLLDEPLNNLDMKHSVQMMRQIRRAADELGKTIVLVVHDLNFAVAYSDQIVAIKQGRIAYDGPVDGLMDEEKLEGIFDTRIKVDLYKDKKFCVYYRVDD